MGVLFLRLLKEGEIPNRGHTLVEEITRLLYEHGDINRIGVSHATFLKFVLEAGNSAKYSRVGKKMAVSVVFAANRPAKVYCEPTLVDNQYRLEHDPKVV